jgi:hypothetical protein
MQMEAVAKAAAGTTLAETLDASQPLARLPLLPISMPPAGVSLSFSLPVCPAHPTLSTSAPVASGGDKAAALASAIQTRLASTLLHSGGGGSPAADGACAYSFATLELKKPRASQEEVGPGGGGLDGAGGVAGAAMATLESLGMKISGSAIGGVSAVHEQLHSVLGQQGVFPSQLFSSAFGHSK